MKTKLWGVLWISENKLDGVTRHLVLSCCKPVLFTTRAPVLFTTRAQARRYIEENYGYIRKRPDLRREPHGWKMPVPVKVTVEASI